MINRILTPRELLVGGGAVNGLPSVLQKLGVSNPLFVVDPGVFRLGLADAIIESIRAEGASFGVFSDVVEDPTDVSVAQVVVLLAEGKHDGVIAIGGGSAIDTAKAAAIVHSTGENVRALKVPRIVDFDVMPLVAIPTTAGTGSEVTRACVITDSERHEKMLILGTAALPTAAIVDFELTLSCPYRVTVDTGLDALTHALEALVNRNRNPHADALALSALKLIGANLETVCSDPQNRSAREAMMLGATHAGLAVSNTSTALVHGLSRPIGAFFHVPHGLSNAMLLPLVTEYSVLSAPEEYAAASRALGFATEADSSNNANEKLIVGFRRLNNQLKVPTLRAYGIDGNRYMELRPEMARQALQSGTPQNNPRVPELEEVIDLYDRAWAE
ncbi:iron-containing alcohol dehydrogenase [Mesorhizobium sp. YR577]|uniref:iron-containing alcohol dehydrogenase n=1 Tax=Mesorhizobium sp. YR577 TaxID=1884373 RepID=UPI0008EB6BAE|nr:iron-containing alcohol dehydrogenase [Mesorhizobium sp. YR577]SFT59232.1 Alcohol dehydrogenase, class IV [Mesorhizobium sp. YR577]